MDVRMVEQIRRPGLQNAEETDVAADKTFIGGNLPECLRRRLEEEGITEFLMRTEDRPKRIGKRKGCKEIGNGQKPVELFFQPAFGFIPSASGAVAVVARMISVLLGFALGAVIPSPAHHLRPALQDVGESLNMGRRHLILIPVKIRLAEKVKQIGESHLDHIAHNMVNR